MSNHWPHFKIRQEISKTVRNLSYQNEINKHATHIHSLNSATITKTQKTQTQG